jgi:hypothetical protein
MRLKEASDTITRPSDTTQYASGDLVANSTTAASVEPLQFNVSRGGIRVVNAKISKADETDVTGATFRLHLFGEEPTVANGDNGAISFDISDYIGYIDFDTMVAATDEAYTYIHAGDTGFNNGAAEGFYHSADSQYIYGLLEARGTYTPATGEIFTLTLTIEHY